jgi:hypothetical protein
MAVEATGQPLPATGSLFRLARLGWYAAAALAVGILLASIPGYLTLAPLSVLQDVLVFERTPFNQALVWLNAGASLFAAVLSIGLATLLFLRRSGERMGLFLAYYLLVHGILNGGPLEMLQPIWPAAPWVSSFIVTPIYAGPMTMVLFGMFPDGRFVPRWSRWLIPASAVIFPPLILGSFDLMPFIPKLPMPIVLVAALTGGGSLIALAIYAQAQRYRHVSTPVQRQQTKWVLYGLALQFFLMLAWSPAWVTAFSLPAGSAAPWWLLAAALAFSVSACFLPVAMTIAVMRYRLFDIDHLINRTLVYGALTGLLALVYFGSVVLLQEVFPTGSQVSVVVSTLAIAALFAPVRRWTQNGIDKRFYRRKYDAALILSRFSAEMRDQVDLDRLTLTLTATVKETLQPSDLALWLRKPER